ncbi:MAG: efflux RND transporter periplasmic adaptor subunit [Wenzhouxiangella sp.]|jgi:Cu(I)/Ag(I) efflux system membrane fusion protein|nr:efflux RND transporter periplasmic adaptor subunit [Wenzhouxiangella sp.]
MKNIVPSTLVLLSVLALAGFGMQPVAARQAEAQFTCPMHPHYISSDPDAGCPICGMDLVPMESGSQDAGGESSGIAVSPEMIQTMGVRTAQAATAEFGRVVRAFGNVEPNTRREAISASRFEGWIEDLVVTAEGDSVRPGQLLYRIYSPELIAAQRDFLTALENGNETRIGASEQRLRSLGMQRATINNLRRERRLIERIPVYAEAGGIVQSLEARDGLYVKPGDAVLRLQSYADVWVKAHIAEEDVAYVSTGIPVTLSFPSAPNAPREGRVDYVYPTIDPKTRTLEVRIVVDNEAGYLRPGAFADVAFSVDEGEKLSVPSEAVLRSSRGGHVILALDDGRFAPRDVETGVSAAGRTEILAGLEPGERVVVSGQFLLDSEVNLREGFSRMSGPTIDPDTPLSELPVDSTALSMIDHIVDAGLYLHEALVDRYQIDPFFLDPAIAAGDQLKQRFSNSKLVPIIDEAQAALSAAKDAAFGPALAVELAKLMDALQPWLLDGAPIHYRDNGLTLYRETQSGRLWLQLTGRQLSPYGDGEAEIVPWPDPMAEMDNSSAQDDVQAVDPHAGHR